MSLEFVPTTMPHASAAQRCVKATLFIDCLPTPCWEKEGSSAAGLGPLGGGSDTRACQTALVGSVVPPFHDSDLFLGQPIQLIHQRVDLLIGGLDVALVELLVGGDGGGGHFLVQVQHALNKCDKPTGCLRTLLVRLVQHHSPGGT
jgi:hypothetical protein